jgi:hypothetical protein
MQLKKMHFKKYLVIIVIQEYNNQEENFINRA